MILGLYVVDCRVVERDCWTDISNYTILCGIYVSSGGD